MAEMIYDIDEVEFMKAMYEYKRKNSRPHPTYAEVLGVAESLGYRKVAAPSQITTKHRAKGSRR